MVPQSALGGRERRRYENITPSNGQNSFFVQVKNKSPAPVQITAEQIIRTAQERQDAEYAPPRQKITDAEELDEYRLRKRKEFEDQIRRQRGLMSNWLKYAKWEESQGEIQRYVSHVEVPWAFLTHNFSTDRGMYTREPSTLTIKM